MARGKLAGVRVCLSAGLDLNPPDPRTSEVTDFIVRLVREIVREGGLIVHGSQPAIVEILRQALADRAAKSRECLTLVRPARFWKEKYAGDIETQRTFARVQRIPGKTETGGVDQHSDSEDSATSFNEDLVPMRDWMAERCDVVIALAGRWWDADKERAGIPIEIDAFLAIGKPAFVITAFGGAADGYAKDDPTLLGRLNNGLDAKANEALAEECGDPNHRAAAVERIVMQIGRLPLGRRGVEIRHGDRGPPAGNGMDAPQRDTLRILCLDGGGIRGAFTAAVLARWAEASSRRVTPEHFIDQFDLVAGTSTGSILAVGLAMGIPPRELVALYQQHGRLIFPRTVPFGGYVTRKYDSNPLRNALEQHLGDRVLGDARRPLVIPTVRARNGKAIVMTTPHCEARVLHRTTSAVDAVMASAAAPVFF